MKEVNFETTKLIKLSIADYKEKKKEEKNRIFLLLMLLKILNPYIGIHNTFLKHVHQEKEEVSSEMEKLVIKFDYMDGIKKIRIPREQATWREICR